VARMRFARCNSPAANHSLRVFPAMTPCGRVTRYACASHSGTSTCS